MCTISASQLAQCHRAADCVCSVLMTVNFQEVDHGQLMFKYLQHIRQPGMPLMVMEFWTGWFDHWAEKHHVVDNTSEYRTAVIFIHKSLRMFSFILRKICVCFCFLRKLLNHCYWLRDYSNISQFYKKNLSKNFVS